MTLYVKLSNNTEVICKKDKKSIYVSGIIRHHCCLVAWSDFFAGIPILGCFLAQPVSLGFTGLSFFLFYPYGLGVSPVNPLDYVKKIGKYKMENPPKNLTRLQG